MRFVRAHFAKFGDFSLDFEVVYNVLDGDYNRYMDIQLQINLALMQRFEEERIAFAYLTQLLYVRIFTILPTYNGKRLWFRESKSVREW